MPKIVGGNTWQHAQQVYGGPTQQHAISSVSNEIAYNVISGGRKTNNKKTNKKTNNKRLKKTNKSNKKTNKKTIKKNKTRKMRGGGSQSVQPANLDDLISQQNNLSAKYAALINPTDPAAPPSGSPIHVDEIPK